MPETQHFGHLLGYDIVRDREEAPYIAVEIEPKHRQVNGVVHGSVIHGLLDTAMGLTTFRANGRKPCATAEISIRYLEPVFEGRLEARARIVKLGKRLVTLDGSVTCDGKPVAVGQATFVTL